MYTIYVDGELLYSPTLIHQGRAVFNPKLTLEINKAGSLTFLLPPDNIMYGEIHKLKSIITVLQNDEEIFRGRVLHDERDFYNRKDVYCEGELSFLLDSPVRPTELNINTVEELFRWCIRNHNESMDESKKFSPGIFDITSEKVTEEQRIVSSYTTTFDYINTQFIEKYGGYLRIRIEDGKRYLDYVKECGSLIDQTIEFGVNLLDISEYISADDVFTCLIPLGTRSSSSESEDEAPYVLRCGACDEEMAYGVDISESGDESSATKYTCPCCFQQFTVSSWGVPKSEELGMYLMLNSQKNKDIEGYKYSYYSYVGEYPVYIRSSSHTGSSSEEFINIQYATDTDSLPEGIHKAGDTLRDEAAAALFGRIYKIHKWDNISDPDELMKHGVSLLQSGIKRAVTLTCKAVDLYTLNVDTEKIKLGSYVRVVSPPHEIDSEFLCSKITMDLVSPDKNEYTLGVNHTTFTENHIGSAKIAQNTSSALANTLDNNNSNSADIAYIRSELDDEYVKVKTFDEKMTQAAIFKLLTNDGAIQGMIMDEETGDIYINASYIRSGTLTLGGKKPKLEIVNDDGVVCVVADEKGVRILDGEVNATSGTLENMSIVNGITISSKDKGVDKVPLISIEPYEDETGKKLYQIVFGYDNSDPNKGNTTVVFDFDDVHLKNALHFDRDDTEKQIHFKTKTNEGTYQHQCKIYGGNASSPIGIGVYSYEDDDVKRVWAYDDQQKHLVSDVPLASYPLEITLGDGASSVDNRSICQQLTRAARLHTKFTSKAISANTTTTLGTISTNYAPKGFDVILSAYTAKTVCDVFLTAKGYIKIKAPNAIAAGEMIFIDGSWIY